MGIKLLKNDFPKWTYRYLYDAYKLRFFLHLRYIYNKSYEYTNLLTTFEMFILQNYILEYVDNKCFICICQVGTENLFFVQQNEVHS